METIFQHIPKSIQLLVYADDIIVLSCGRFPSIVRRNMQSAINQINNWAKNIGFTLSPDKSAVMHLSNKRRGLSKIPNLTINDRAIVSTKSIKILGVTIDCKLNFSEHSTNVYRANEGCIRLLKTISGKAIGANRQTMLNILNCWMLPKMLYGYGLYSRGGMRVIDKLSPIYHRALRCITGAFITSPIPAKLVESGVLPFTHIAAYSLIGSAIRLLEKTAGRSDCPLVLRARETFNQISNLDIPQICAKTFIAGRPWNKSAPTIDLSLLSRASRNTPNIKALFYELINNKYSNYKQMFTDGSMASEASACGIWDGTSNRSFRLPRQCSAFSTEAHAMFTAIEEHTIQNQPTIILSDSASCLRALESGKSSHPWIQNLETVHVVRTSFSAGCRVTSASLEMKWPTGLPMLVVLKMNP